MMDVEGGEEEEEEKEEKNDIDDDDDINQSINLSQYIPQFYKPPFPSSSFPQVPILEALYTNSKGCFPPPQKALDPTSQHLP